VQRATWYDTAGFVAWLLLTAVLTLTPVRAGPVTVQPLCLWCGDMAGSDIVSNILLFAPAGLFLARRGVSVFAAIAIGLAISTGIEIAQIFVPGRYSTIRDIITNGLGAGAGAVFSHVMVHGLRTGSRLVLAAAAALPVGAVAITGGLMQPVSTDGVYFGHWVPERPHYAPWNGQVLAVDVDGLPARSGPLDNTDATRSALERGQPVHLWFVQGDPPSGTSAIFHIVDDSKREILMIGVHGTDLVVRPRLRANEARLDFTDQRFVGFFNATSRGDTVSLSVETDHRGRSCVSAAHAAACAPYPSIGTAWQLLLWKGSLPELTRRALHGMTILLLLLPLGILCIRQPRRTGIILLAATTIAMILAGRALGLAWPGAAELLPAVGLVAVMLGSSRALRGDRLP
jgi:VanZ family protein